jgi:hypothetical protein
VLLWINTTMWERGGGVLLRLEIQHLG